MSVIDIVDRWGDAGAPVVKHAEIRQTFDAYFETVAKYGITRKNYLICARKALMSSRPLIEAAILRNRADQAARAEQDAAAAELRRRERPDDERAAARADLAAKRAHWAAARYQAAERDEDRPRWSTIIGTVRSVLNEYGRAGWTVFWSTIRLLSDVFGTPTRSTWERLRILRDIGWLLVWSRWKDDEHVYMEGRSNIYFLRVPEEIWEAWVPTQEAQRLLATLSEGGEIPASSEPPAAVPSTVRRPSRAPVSAQPGAISEPPASSASTDVRWVLEVFIAERSKKYSSDVGDIPAGHLKKIEGYIKGSAETQYNTCKTAGRTPPTMERVRREILTSAVVRWLATNGTGAFLRKNEHAFKYFEADAQRFADEAGKAWLVGWLDEHKVPALELPATVVVGVAQSLAAAGEIVESNLFAGQGSFPEAPRLVATVPRARRMTSEDFAKIREQQAQEPRPPVACDVDTSGDFDTLTSRVDPPPD